MSDKVKKWIFKANLEQTIIIRPTVKIGVFNAQGMMIPGSQINLNPIKLVFNSCHCVVDEDFARANKIKLDDLILLIKAAPQFGKGFVLIHEPDKPASEKVKKEIEKAPKKKVIIHGVRK